MAASNEVTISPMPSRVLGNSRGRLRWIAWAAVALIGMATTVPPGRTAERIDNSTLTGKMIMGYQGWFGCPNDGSGRGWVHWKSGDQWTVDMLPDVSELSPEEKCDTGLKDAKGDPVYVFSSQNPKTVDRHFVWMEQYGLDGVALQRFATQLLRPDAKRSVDRVLENVKAGAEKHGRVFFLMYDLSGMPPDKLDLVVEDWKRLEAAGLTQSPAYLKHKGHPVLGLWGLGFAGRDLPPAVMGGVLDRLKQDSVPNGGLTILGGVPADWRTSTRADPGWAAVWPKLDVISPWTVGAYHDPLGANRYALRTLVPDLAAAKAGGEDLMPVVFPGFSWANLMHARHEDAKAIPNQMPRKAGQFYWEQVSASLASGATMIYTAMFDEVDEGTAIFKIANESVDVPKVPGFVTLDVDGKHLPKDWYLALVGAANRELHTNKTVQSFDAISSKLMPAVSSRCPHLSC